jgi:hypothetical protein
VGIAGNHDAVPMGVTMIVLAAAALILRFSLPRRRSPTALVADAVPVP